jgi:UDPglucose--hexose-1-phosphate uridylyltransferase
MQDVSIVPRIGGALNPRMASSEIRYDPLTGEATIVAPGRRFRPNAHAPRSASSLGHPGGASPFVPGSEEETMPETFAIRDAGSAPNGPGWQLRVIANKYPVLAPMGGYAAPDDGFHRRSPGAGIHEVLVESTDPELDLADMDSEQFRQVFRALRARHRALIATDGIEAVLIFRNYGVGAGASLAHPHTQLLAMPIVPTDLQRELDAAAAWQRTRGVNYFDELIQRELADGARVIRESARFVAIVPWAARAPYEMQIVAREPVSSLDQLDDASLEGFADILRDMLGRLKRTLDAPPYNLIFQSAPRGDHPTYRFSVRVLPRLGFLGGFEWASGMNIISVPPEEAAEKLHAAQP